MKKINLFLLPVLLLSACTNNSGTKDQQPVLYTNAVKDTVSLVPRTAKEAAIQPFTQREIMIHELGSLKTFLIKSDMDSVLRFFDFPVSSNKFRLAQYNEDNPVRDGGKISRNWMMEQYPLYFGSKSVLPTILRNLDLQELLKSDRVHSTKKENYNIDGQKGTITYKFEISVEKQKLVLTLSDQTSIDGTGSSFQWVFTFKENRLTFYSADMAG